MQAPLNNLIESIRSAMTPGDRGIRALIVPNDDPLASGFASFLSKQQRARCRRFDDPADRRAALVCKGLWRLGAGVLLGENPARVELSRDRWNRPQLIGLARDTVDLNVSRTRTHSGLVLSRGCRVGIDLESVAPSLVTDELVRAVMHEADPLDDASDADVFFGLWTHKEAVLKADGRGLEVDPRQVHLNGLGSPQSDWSLCGCHGQAWNTRPLECPPSIKGAIASNHLPASCVQVAWESIVAAVIERGSCAHVASSNP
ncbi:MAG: 4'-phosphopantetheinyl transferase superfamily protein [Phycisphaerales bacterium]|nr:4'-phosphopantetheinyl transferase superfamily protein [Phycisphaerales bacterium]